MLKPPLQPLPRFLRLRSATKCRLLAVLTIASASIVAHGGPVAIDDAATVSGSAGAVGNAANLASFGSDSALTMRKEGATSSKRLSLDALSSGVSGQGDTYANDAASAVLGSARRLTEADGGRRASAGAPSSSAPVAPAASGAQPTLKTAVKSIWKSIHALLPWNHAEAVDSVDSATGTYRDDAEFLGGAGAAQHRPEIVSPVEVVAPEHGERFALSENNDLVRQMIGAWRLIFTHPLTWLVVFLIGAARVAVSILGRRRK